MVNVGFVRVARILHNIHLSPIQEGRELALSTCSVADPDPVRSGLSGSGIKTGSGTGHTDPPNLLFRYIILFKLQFRQIIFLYLIVSRCLNKSGEKLT